jgi:hypothetical protein
MDHATDLYQHQLKAEVGSAQKIVRIVFADLFQRFNSLQFLTRLTLNSLAPTTFTMFSDMLIFSLPSAIFTINLELNAQN